jgi:hypothetical protein
MLLVSFSFFSRELHEAWMLSRLLQKEIFVWANEMRWKICVSYHESVLIFLFSNIAAIKLVDEVLPPHYGEFAGAMVISRSFIAVTCPGRSARCVASASRSISHHDREISDNHFLIVCSGTFEFLTRRRLIMNDVLSISQAPFVQSVRAIKLDRRTDCGHRSVRLSIDCLCFLLDLETAR